MSDHRSLERLVGDADGFVAGRFDGEPHLRSGPPFDDLLTLADVDEALTGAGLRRPAVRVVRDGSVVDPALWTRRARTGAVTIDDLIDPARLLDLHADGATIVLQSMQRWWPPIARFCRDLELTLSHAVQANAYLTPAGSVGLSPHHDTHDVFVVQLHGSKHWTVREPLVDSPLRRHRSDAEAASRQPVVLECELVPGECLYLPRGTIHSATAQEGASLHLTIGVLATTAHDVVRRVASLAADVPALRRTLPWGWANDPASAEAAVKEALTELAGFVGSIEAADVGDHLTERFLATRQPILDGQLLQLVQLGQVTDESVVERRPGLAVRTTHHDGRLVLGLGDRTVDLPGAIAPAVERLLAGKAIRPSALSDLLDESSRLVLVRRLVRDGVLRTVESQRGGTS